MAFELACADFTFPLLSHEHSMDLIAMLGFEGVDIGLFENRSHLQPSREFADATKSAAALRAKLDERGLRAADVFLQMELDFVPYAVNHPDPTRRKKARDWYERTVEYAAVLGAKHLTTLPGVHFDDESRSESLARAGDELAWRVARAEEANLTFAVEAHLGSIVPDPESALDLLERVPGLTLTLDYTHFARNGMPDSRVEPLIAHASHFHARGAKEGRLQTSFKDNTIDYERIVRRMRDTGYSGFIGIEYTWTEWERCNETDNVSETVLFRDFFRRMTCLM